MNFLFTASASQRDCSFHNSRYFAISLSISCARSVAAVYANSYRQGADLVTARS